MSDTDSVPLKVHSEREKENPSRDWTLNLALSSRKQFLNELLARWRSPLPSIDPSEYAPYFASFIERVPQGPPISEQLEDQRESLTAFFQDVSFETWDHAYAPGKWTVRQVLAHLVDTERVMATRALYFARGATQVEHPDMDPDLFVAGARDCERSPDSLLAEFRSLRNANLHLVSGWGDEILDRRGAMAGATMTVRAILFVMLGHPAHHCQVLVERYGVSAR